MVDSSCQHRQPPPDGNPHLSRVAFLTSVVRLESIKAFASQSVSRTDGRTVRRALDRRTLRRSLAGQRETTLGQWSVGRAVSQIPTSLIDISQCGPFSRSSFFAGRPATTMPFCLPAGRPASLREVKEEFFPLCGRQQSVLPKEDGRPLSAPPYHFTAKPRETSARSRRATCSVLSPREELRSGVLIDVSCAFPTVSVSRGS